jgi:hypothetical protein
MNRGKIPKNVLYKMLKEDVQVKDKGKDGNNKLKKGYTEKGLARKVWRREEKGEEEGKKLELVNLKF